MTDRFQNHSVFSEEELSQNSSGAIAEADVLMTAVLMERPTRQPDLVAENQALRTLSQQLMEEPQSLLRTLVQIAKDLCQADTAGVSLLETVPGGTSVFRWVAIAGSLKSLEQTTTPANFSPCGTTIRCGCPQLYAYPERYFTYLYHPQLPIVEGLLFPLYVNNQPLGTIWIVSHHEQRQFDREDQRLMTSLTGFTAAALQSIHLRQTAQEALRREQEIRTQQEQAETSLRQSEAFNQQILNSSDDCIKILDLSGRLLYMNQRGQASIGIQEMDPFLNTAWVEFWQKADDRQAALDALDMAKAGGVGNFQGYCPTLAGEPKWWDVKLTPIRGAEGQVERLLCVSRDITERRRIEEEGHKNQERLSAIFSQAAVGLCEISLEGYFQRVNDELCKMLGRSREEMLSASVPDVTHPDDVLKSLQALEQLIETGQPVSFDKRYLRPDGTIVWANSSLKSLDNEQGRPRSVLAVTVDLSGRKRTEEILRRTAELDAFRISLADALRPLTDASEIQAIAARILGESLQATRVIYTEIVSDGEEVIVHRNYTNGVAQLSGRYRLEDYRRNLTVDHQAGHPLVVTDIPNNPRYTDAQKARYRELDIAAHIDVPLIKNDRFVALLAVHQSTPRQWTETEVKLVEETAERTWAAVERAHAEAALRDSENRFRMAIESAQLGTWDWNLVTNQLIWDEGCKAMFGLPPEAKSSIEVFFAGLHPDDRDRLEQVVQWTLNPASSGKYDVEYRTLGIQDGVERWIAARGQAYFDVTGKPQRFVGTVLNITEQKRIEAEREQLLAREQAARAEADRVNRIKDEFLAVLSHELRSPLNPILGWSTLLLGKKLDEAKTAQALATIQRNAKLQSELIEDLLDVSRILRGKLSLNVAVVNLVSIIEAAMETVRLAAQAKLIQVEASFAPDVGLVLGDSTRLQQVIWNLLSNAVKFTPNGGRVNIRLESLDSYAQITVSDNGQGIEPDFLPYVFDHFRQANAATTRQFGGLGLGLAIVRHLVELHGGTVGVESLGVGMGATFTVRLPLMPTQATANQNSRSSESSFDLNGIQVLVVDDESDSREFVAFVLEQAGADVITATTADEALKMLMQSQPDVLLSDIGMPDTDGYMLIQQVRALPKEQGGQVTAIALTAYAGDFNQQQALSAGFQQHVSKPVEPEVLVRAIASLLSHTKC
ncbi:MULTISPECIES: PAS domain S-box protein [Nostocales]|nr:PAS domain S-box protein [Tolypothrix bouteillei]